MPVLSVALATGNQFEKIENTKCWFGTLDSKDGKYWQQRRCLLEYIRLPKYSRLTKFPCSTQSVHQEIVRIERNTGKILSETTLPSKKSWYWVAFRRCTRHAGQRDLKTRKISWNDWRCQTRHVLHNRKSVRLEILRVVIGDLWLKTAKEDTFRSCADTS